MKVIALLMLTLLASCQAPLRTENCMMDIVEQEWCDTCEGRGYVVMDAVVVQCDDCKGHWHWYAVLTMTEQGQQDRDHSHDQDEPSNT